MKNRYFLYKSSLVAALAGFLFGFDTVVISGAEQTIQSIWKLSPGLHGIAISMALWGTVLGAMVGGMPTEKFGRRKTLLSVGMLYLLSAIGSAFAPEVYSFMFFRFIGGVGIGISTIATPLYISEIAPPDYRGRLTGMFQFNIVFGILIAYLSNALLGNIGENAWRWMLGVEAIPALIYFIFSFGLPESPRWLVIRKKDIKNASLIFKKVNDGITERDLKELLIEVEASAAQNQSSREFLRKSLLKPIFLAFLIAFFNQLSGINAILYFAPRIFKMTGLGSEAALLQSLGIGVTNLIFTFVGLWLIDIVGRRTLLYIGSFGYIISLGATALAFLTEHYVFVPVCIFMFIAAHAVGQGAVIWVFISEIFPNRYRAAGQTLGSFTHWFFAASLTLVFPKMAEALAPSLIFGIFCFMMILQLVWVKTMVPETKGISLEKMGKKLNIS
ncbi:MAG: sugar porter family MFS transporter [Prolixibacteraceae bacterium]|nr:sugar porter family MFS transporter [Prolixibacteraceae bacterium]